MRSDTKAMLGHWSTITGRGIPYMGEYNSAEYVQHNTTQHKCVFLDQVVGVPSPSSVYCFLLTRIGYVCSLKYTEYSQCGKELALILQLNKCMRVS